MKIKTKTISRYTTFDEEDNEVTVVNNIAFEIRDDNNQYVGSATFTPTMISLGMPCNLSPLEQAAAKAKLTEIVAAVVK